MAREIQQILLNERGYSGKMYRFQTLLPSRADLVTRNAAKESTTTALDFRLTQLRLGVAAMIIAITKERVPMKLLPVIEDGKPKLDPTTKDPILAPQLDMEWLSKDDNWVKPDPVMFATSYDTFIDNPKDDDALGKLYSHLHEADMGAVDRILGKAQTVSTG